MRLSLKAIAVGGVVDIVATNIATAPVYVGLLAANGAVGSSGAQTTKLLTESLNASPTLYTSMMLLGSACSILGGWIAARIAKRDEALHGALSAFLCVGFGAYGWIRGSGTDVSAFEHLAFLVLSPALGAFGGILRARMVQHGLVSVPTDEMSSPPAMVGWKRVLYVVDRVLQWVALVFLALFGLTALYGRGAGDRNMLIGGVVLAIVGAILALLYFLAARALARGGRHWPLHAAAVALTLIPVALFGFVAAAG
jgi:hypothetical protein